MESPSAKRRKIEEQTVSYAFDFLDLPHDLQVFSLSYLSLRDLLSAKNTCKRVHRLLFTSRLLSSRLRIFGYDLWRWGNRSVGDLRSILNTIAAAASVPSPLQTLQFTLCSTVFGWKVTYNLENLALIQDEGNYEGKVISGAEAIMDLVFQLPLLRLDLVDCSVHPLLTEKFPSTLTRLRADFKRTNVDTPISCPSTKLRVLELNGAKFGWEKWLCQLPNLTELTLGGETGRSSFYLGAFTNLKKFSMIRPIFSTENDPGQIFLNLPSSLTWVYLSHGPPEDISSFGRVLDNLTSLRRLTLIDLKALTDPEINIPSQVTHLELSGVRTKGILRTSAARVDLDYDWEPGFVSIQLLEGVRTITYLAFDRRNNFVANLSTLPASVQTIHVTSSAEVRENECKRLRELHPNVQVHHHEVA
eukprot:TRINITY_DN12174_c0_g1_i1.p1 TRINITY_DN12174_c0_g1~~TRINITY_DN12174_c0_g1_i1.p1  ORF type:complete len:417 (-),score=62.14 TRINITY_DN12174_c0_g1_i1:13-1263(-)